MMLITDGGEVECPECGATTKASLLDHLARSCPGPNVGADISKVLLEEQPSTDENLVTDGGWPVSDPVEHSDYVPLDMANNIDDERVRERIAWIDGFGRAYADSLEAATRDVLATDGGETEYVPWCDECETISVPLEDGSCGVCGSDTRLLEGQR